MKITTSIFLLLCSSILFAQDTYEVSIENPYGRYNPKAPEQLLNYKQLIGLCDCKSESRNADGSWANPVDMTWKWKYIMNGMAIQDETIKKDGKHSGSIRQYSKDSIRWYVHYYASATIATRLSTWEGNKKGNDIVLYRDNTAPNGTPGFYRLTFSNISDKGFNWVGEWTDKTEKIIYPTWKIACTKREETNN